MSPELVRLRGHVASLEESLERLREEVALARESLKISEEPLESSDEGLAQLFSRFLWRRRDVVQPVKGRKGHREQSCKPTGSSWGARRLSWRGESCYDT